jgi:hypothetical protein
VIKKRNAVKSIKQKAMPARNVQNLNKFLGICFFFFQFSFQFFSKDDSISRVQIAKVFTADYRSLNIFSTLQINCRIKKIEFGVGAGRSIKSLYVTGGREFYFENYIGYQLPVSKRIFFYPQWYVSWEYESRFLNYMIFNLLGGVECRFSFHDHWSLFQGIRVGLNHFLINTNGNRLSSRQANYQSHIGIRYVF